MLSFQNVISLQDRPVLSFLWGKCLGVEESNRMTGVCLIFKLLPTVVVQFYIPTSHVGELQLFHIPANTDMIISLYFSHISKCKFNNDGHLFLYFLPSVCLLWLFLSQIYRDLCPLFNWVVLLLLSLIILCILDTFFI